MEIAIIAAEYVCFPTFGGLRYVKIIVIAQRSVVWVLDDDRLAHFLKKLCIVVEFVFRQRMQPLQSRVAKYLDCLHDNLIGMEQRVTTLKQGGQQLSPLRTTTRVRTHQDSRIKNNSQPAGL